MANFKTHVTTSSICGIAYGACGYFVGGFSAPNCIVAAGLGGVAGMFPDLDSDNSVPVREMFCLAAAAIPVALLHRLIMMGLSHEEILIVGATIYAFVRFVVAKIFKKYTVHRGMWHSIPACATSGLLAYIICSSDERARTFKAMAVVIGFMSHLILDEIYSVDLRNRRIKKSFGTAFKFFGPKLWPNVSTYAKLAVLVLAVTLGERQFLEYFREPANRFHYRSGEMAERAQSVIDQVMGVATATGEQAGLLQERLTSHQPSSGPTYPTPYSAPPPYAAPPYAAPPYAAPPYAAPPYAAPPPISAPTLTRPPGSSYQPLIPLPQSAPLQSAPRRNFGELQSTQR